MKKSFSVGRGKPVRKAGTGPRKIRGGRARDFLPLLFAVWVMAAVLLAGVLFWGSGVGRKKPPLTQVPDMTARRHHDPLPTQTTENRPLTQVPDMTARQPLPALAQPRPLNVAAAPKAPAAPPLPDLTPPIARVAIVIDDMGQNIESLKELLGIPLPLTFSILPYQHTSREEAQLAHNQGHEVLLHLPMEPKSYPRISPGSGALLLSMSSGDIKKAVGDALDVSPYVTGVNNHMGSAFTEQEGPMEVVLDQIRGRGLYFLDSYTSPQSIGFSLARRMSVPSAQRDVFLDNVNERNYIRARIGQLIRKARIQGSAIAIGHPRYATIEVLREEAKRFHEEKIEVVPLGALVGTGIAQNQ